MIRLNGVEIPLNPLDAKVRELHKIMRVLKLQYRNNYAYTDYDSKLPLWYLNSPARLFFEYVRVIIRMLGLAKQYADFITINEDRIFQSKRQYGHVELLGGYKSDTRKHMVIMESYNLFDCIYQQFYDFLIEEPKYIRELRFLILSMQNINTGRIIGIAEPLVYKYYIHGTVRQNTDKPNYDQLFSESDCKFDCKRVLKL
jgi:hypothetical protein